MSTKIDQNKTKKTPQPVKNDRSERDNDHENHRRDRDLGREHRGLVDEDEEQD